MSRWKYKTETVTAGENSQKVRQLTAGERHQFAMATKKAKEDPSDQTDRLRMLATFGCVDPELTEADVDAMPGDLLGACVEKIMELSGLGGKKDDEKKALNS